MKKLAFSWFTVENYKSLLKLAKTKYRFATYSEYESCEKIVIYRHDIDLSPHRAVKLAEVEREEGVVTTYFVHLHSTFYNILEHEITQCIEKILTIGHRLGLHFDPSFYSGRTHNKKLEHWLLYEKEMIERLFNTQVEVFSLHNPDSSDWVKREDNKIAGLINTYGKIFREEFDYCSDSNGYWRYKSLDEVLRKSSKHKLQVLTHPGWWLEQEMSPRQRIQRCIEGRARKVAMRYDRLLYEMSRNNFS